MMMRVIKGGREELIKCLLRLMMNREKKIVKETKTENREKPLQMKTKIIMNVKKIDDVIQNQKRISQNLIQINPEQQHK